VRLQLKPGLQRVGRGPGTVQIGLDPRHGMVLDGLTQPDVALLDDLACGLDDADLLRDPDRSARAHRIVQLLAGAGVLLPVRRRAALPSPAGDRARLIPDATTWSIVHPDAGDGWQLLADRSRRNVEIRGCGRIGLTLAATLAATGVANVRVHAQGVTTPGDVSPGGAVPDDVGAPLQDAAQRAIGRALRRSDVARGDIGPSDAGRGEIPGGIGGHEGVRRARRTAPAEPACPATVDLVVLIDRGAADAAAADPLLAQDVPHLSVVVRESSILVGPLVLPGRGPCLRCLDLHRSERDPQWPLVLAQLVSSAAARSAPREETASAQIAAGLATLQVLGQLDGQHTPSALGATLEIELPDGLVSRRPWPAHPACGCHWPPATTRDVSRARTRAAVPEQ
jgi:bacteriocin biosynthesis cyclodehydratase domain-containing protein